MARKTGWPRLLEMIDDAANFSDDLADALEARSARLYELRSAIPGTEVDEVRGEVERAKKSLLRAAEAMDRVGVYARRMKKAFGDVPAKRKD